jgi:hypothetical protein
VGQVTATLNSQTEVAGKLELERLHLQTLPVECFADYEPVVARVRSTSTIEVRSITDSVPTWLIGQQLTVHLHHDRLDLFLRSEFVETLPRLHRRAGASGPVRRIDFRHVIDSLGRKPRALLQADILASENWRKLWRQLLAALPPDEAAKVIVEALHVAARTDDLSGVERYLHRQLRSGGLSLSSLRDDDLRPPRGLMAMPVLLGGAPQPAGAGNSPAIPPHATETGAIPQPVAGGGEAGRQCPYTHNPEAQCPPNRGNPSTARRNC